MKKFNSTAAIVKIAATAFVVYKITFVDVIIEKLGYLANCLFQFANNKMFDMLHNVLCNI